VDLHLVVAAPGRLVARGLADEVVDRIGAPAATAIGVHAVGRRAPELGERQAGLLARQIPERDVERRQGIARDAYPANAAVGTVHLVPEPADQERILADEQFAEALRIGFDGL
jgi:hypothetical protein